MSKPSDDSPLYYILSQFIIFVYLSYTLENYNMPRGEEISQAARHRLSSLYHLFLFRQPSKAKKRALQGLQNRLTSHDGFRSSALGSQKAQSRIQVSEKE